MWRGKWRLTSFASRRRSCTKAKVLLASHIASKNTEDVVIRGMLRMPIAATTHGGETPWCIEDRETDVPECLDVCCLGSFLNQV